MSIKTMLLAELVKGILGMENQFPWNGDAVVQLLGDNEGHLPSVLDDEFLQAKPVSIRCDQEDVSLCFKSLGPENVDSYTLLDFIQKLVRRGVQLALLPEGERGIELVMKLVRCEDGKFEIFPTKAIISRRLRHPHYLSDFDVLSLLCPDDLPPDEKSAVQAVLPDMVSRLFPPEDWDGEWGEKHDGLKAAVINNALLYLAFPNDVEFSGSFPTISPMLPASGSVVERPGFRIASRRVAAVARLFGLHLLEPTDQQLSNSDSCHQVICGSRTDPFVPITYLFKSNHSYGKLVAARSSNWPYLGEDSTVRPVNRKSIFATRVLHAVIDRREKFWEAHPGLFAKLRERILEGEELPVNLGTAKTLLATFVERSQSLFSGTTAELRSISDEQRHLESELEENQRDLEKDLLDHRQNMDRVMHELQQIVDRMRNLNQVADTAVTDAEKMIVDIEQRVQDVGRLGGATSTAAGPSGVADVQPLLERFETLEKGLSSQGERVDAVLAKMQQSSSDPEANTFFSVEQVTGFDDLRAEISEIRKSLENGKNGDGFDLICRQQREILEELAAQKRGGSGGERLAKEGIQWLHDALDTLLPTLADIDLVGVTKAPPGTMFHRSPAQDVEDESRGRLYDIYNSTESDPVLLRVYYCVWAVVDALHSGISLKNPKDLDRFNRVVDILTHFGPKDEHFTEHIRQAQLLIERHGGRF